MASPAPASSSGGVTASMWAGQPSPASPASNRGGWGSSGSAFRGIPKGRGGGRGAPRGGGRGGRPVSISRGGAPGRNEGPQPKPGADQPKEKPVKAPVAPAVKPTATPSSKPAAPSSVSPTTQQPGPASKGPARPKPMSRKPSEQKTPRPKAPSVSEAPPAPPTHSPALSTASTTASRNSGRRKRSNAKPPPAPARKTSVSVEPAARPKPERPAAIVTKDVPPHLAAVPDTPSFDIKHSVDALVERVRAVAMDRPNTPGSHIDWAGDDDDSLPDLDDWGVTSSTAGTAEPASENGASRIISPILEDTLKPLPSLDHSEVPYSLEGGRVGVKDGESQDKTAKAETGSNISSGSSVAPNDSSATTSPPKSTGAVPLHPSLPLKPANASDPSSKRGPRRSDPPFKGKADPSNDSSAIPHIQVMPPARLTLEERLSSKESSPERGLAGSIHALPTSLSAPSDVTMHSIPGAHRHNQFSPTHNRAHTVGSRVNRQPFTAPIGSFSDHAVSDSERPRRGDHAHHARTQSTPPTGPGAHTRTPHASRPVITGDAISKLARTLGRTPLRREVTTAVPAEPVKE
ncbi:hypothetical protein EIP91_012056 [Steccherinum ochraceum]|uniref:Uncharacterized protein n=1 Tax=Steccherinum ochraceum TaxID=92696 RepID=A0A4R0RGW2_9APHY|nr:hypothetical protein EIP91_012056 [Steccherinum ochraceum]